MNTGNNIFDNPIWGNNNEIMVVYTINGAKAESSLKGIVGYCNCLTHPGYLFKNDYIKHDCKNKSCAFFIENPYSSFILNQRLKQREKDRIKRKEKEKNNYKKFLERVRSEFQQYADEVEPDMYIVRVNVDRAVYTIYYVSNVYNHFKGMHEALASRIRKRLPKIILRFVHIKAIDGHYFTKDEYMLNNIK